MFFKLSIAIFLTLSASSQAFASNLPECEIRQKITTSSETGEFTSEYQIWRKFKGQNKFSLYRSYALTTTESPDPTASTEALKRHLKKVRKYASRLCGSVTETF